VFAKLRARLKKARAQRKQDREEDAQRRAEHAREEQVMKDEDAKFANSRREMLDTLPHMASDCARKLQTLANKKKQVVFNEEHPWLLGTVEHLGMVELLVSGELRVRGATLFIWGLHFQQLRTLGKLLGETRDHAKQQIDHIDEVISR